VFQFFNSMAKNGKRKYHYVTFLENNFISFGSPQ
jgi:hypothetical protein